MCFCSAAPVTFRDALVGDVLTSTVRVSLDLIFGVLYALYWVKGLFVWRRSDLAVDPISGRPRCSMLADGEGSLDSGLIAWAREYRMCDEEHN
jgi:hypothetical protein